MCLWNSGYSGFRYLGFVCVFAVFSMGYLGCSGKSVDENDPATLYKDAEEELKNDHYQLAIDKLNVIRNKFPYSNYATDAQLKIADAYFLQESYAEAATSYESFRDLHPKHEKVGYAMFRIAKSYYLDTPSPVARDLTPAQKALDAYQEYLRRFPTAAEAPEARTDLSACRKLLADKELYIGDFYYKRDVYDSARSRYEKIVTVYPETDAAKVAREKIDKIDAYEAKRHPGHSETNGSPPDG